MRVLLIATEKLPVPPIRGGAIQTYISGVAPMLSNKHDLTILGISDPALPERETVKRISYVRLSGKQNLENYRKEIINFLKKNSFDIIHMFNRPYLVRAVRETAPKSKIVLSMHNDMFGPDKIHPEEGEYAINQVDRIVTVSNYIGQNISNLFPAAAKKIRTIYSGVDLSRFVPYYSKEAQTIRNTLRKKHNLQNKKIILYVGRLSPKKGADILVWAMRELVKKHKNCVLVLVGSNWYSENLVSDYVAFVRALATRSPIPVISTGFVTPDEVHQWYMAADIFVCTSQWQEPLARVHYEAMAAGLPIITTRRGGNVEVIQDNGLIVEKPEDPAEFAKKLSVLLEDPKLREKMGRKGRSMAEEKYSWKRVAEEILEVWAELYTINEAAVERVSAKRIRQLG
ncbi:glycosyltransferase family 4 protein [Brevibacillus sp. H7]|uniref:glycosyltransferase family 4 protein n=1 Tax=Brevibacillus sp. H7 TaxID=3349138 RepID=UPI003829A64D